MGEYRFTIFLILGIALMAVALLQLFRAKHSAAVFACLGLLSLHFSTYIFLSNSALWQWPFMTALIESIHFLGDKDPLKMPTAPNLYVVLSGLAGTVVGLAINPSYMFLCLIIGTFLGLAAYAKTPQGKYLKFPTFIFIKYFCYKASPIIVTLAMIGIAIRGITIAI